MRKELDRILLIVLFAGIVTMFWNNELVYGLATHVPTNQVQPMADEQADFKEKIETGDHPFFTHIFNSYCPCSLYNISFFKASCKNDKHYVMPYIHT